MKANELMIGDWVEINLSPSVHKSYFKAQIIVSNIVSLENNYDFDARPIPLTEDILKANGFHQLNEVDYEYVYSRNDVMFCVCKRDLTCPYIRFGGYFFCNINYVHELQHALRLCGLNELADNFKIN